VSRSVASQSTTADGFAKGCAVSIGLATLSAPGAKLVATTASNSVTMVINIFDYNNLTTKVFFFLSLAGKTTRKLVY
jgi:hypothetical protein